MDAKDDGWLCWAGDGVAMACIYNESRKGDDEWQAHAGECEVDRLVSGKMKAICMTQQ